jgi:alditol oxidase
LELGNWAGNFRYKAARLHRPSTVAEVQDVVSRSRTVKALGTRHSFNAIADTLGDLISLERLDHIEPVNSGALAVTLQGGVTYGRLCRRLNDEGYALHNMASLPHISVAGACATGTHGSGDRNGNLATAVAAMDVVVADGSLVTFTGEELLSAAVSLGALGIVTRLTLNVVPAYELRQYVFQNLSFAEATARFDEITGSAYSVSLFTDWRAASFNQVWLKSRGPAQMEEFFDAIPARSHLHPIGTMSPENCNDQMGIPGSWHERLPHFRLTHTPSSGEELQSEYLVPRSHAASALLALSRLRDRIAALVQITEVRTIAADNLWMSPCYREDCVAFHFTWHKDWSAVRALLPSIEEALSPFGARPHWGKLFTIESAKLRALFPKFAEFRELTRSYDSHGKFRNEFLDDLMT